MEKSTKKAIMMVDHNKKYSPDFFNHLPDKVLWFILSLLPIDEAVRTSILSKRWRSTPFTLILMSYPLTRLTSSPGSHLEFIFNLDKEKGVYRYNILCFTLMKKHVGNLTSCRFAHFPFIDVTACLSVLLEQEKGLKDLTLECQSIGTMSKPNLPIRFNTWNYLSALESFELVRYTLKYPSSFETLFRKLRTLKLKEIQIGDEIFNGILRSTSLENFTLLQSSGFTKIEIKSSSLKFLELNFLCVSHIEISTPNLKVLVLASLSCPAKNLVLGVQNLSEFHCYSNQQISTSSHVPKTHKLLEYWTGLLECKREKIFRNLSSLSIDLDLNNVREALSLSYLLRTSSCLQTLKIVIPLNVVHIKGFTGKDLEVDFIKYLITRSTRIKKITIICESSLDEANKLLSVNNASSKLFIQLMVDKRAT
ncbi:F-box protein, partial [Mucuna pruriens]